MIHYRCAACGVKLETENSRAGQPEVCPACRQTTVVPETRASRAAKAQTARQEDKVREQTLRREMDAREREVRAETELAEASEAAKARREAEALDRERRRVEAAAAKENRRREARGKEWPGMAVAAFCRLMGILDLVLGIVLFLVGIGSQSGTGGIYIGIGLACWGSCWLPLGIAAALQCLGRTMVAAEACRAELEKRPAAEEKG